MRGFRPAGQTGRWRFGARQAVWAVIDEILPPRCGGCGSAGGRFCGTCRGRLAPIPDPVCGRCGYPRSPAGPCPACHGHLDAALDGLRSVAVFEGPLQNALHRLKYHRDIGLADTLAALLEDAWRRYGLPGQVVVPVPLSARRLRERGYNQAALIARGFSDLTGLPFRPGALARTRHADSQVGLSRAQRQANVAGAFRARAHGIDGQAVVLVDDVCTTGSTLVAAAEALRTAGAAQVWALSVARARLGPEAARP